MFDLLAWQLQSQQMQKNLTRQIMMAIAARPPDVTPRNGHFRIVPGEGKFGPCALVMVPEWMDRLGLD